MTMTDIPSLLLPRVLVNAQEAVAPSDMINTEITFCYIVTNDLAE